MPEFSLILTIISEEVYLSEVGFELNLLLVFEVKNRCIRPAKFSFVRMANAKPKSKFAPIFPKQDSINHKTVHRERRTQNHVP